MRTKGPVQRVLRFGAFELDPHAGELRKRGVKLRLSGQPLQLLAILCSLLANLYRAKRSENRSGRQTHLSISTTD